RAAACAREVELNRRLAPDVYLGVSPVLEGDAVADHMIVMRRMPSARRLSYLVTTDERDEVVRQVARAIAVFHSSLPPDERAARNATCDAMRRLWSSNFDEMRGFAGRLLDEHDLRKAERLAMAYLDGRAPLFRKRIESGFARDGHGDLLADDIFCLDDGPRILDCLAFDDDLRVGDVLLDVAFLAMDLERLAGSATAEAFLEHYVELSGEHHPRSLTHHYVAYRALVRCKVNCMRAEQGDDRAAAEATKHLGIVLAHLRAGRPRLVLVGGAPGTGKTTTATEISQRCGLVLLASDELRKDLAGIPHTEHAFAELGRGIYSPSMTERTYDELVRRAGEVLAFGESVVLDASWHSAAMRERARRIAAEVNADIVELQCVLPVSVAAERIERRLREETSYSDATPSIARALASALDPWPESIELDTHRSPEEVAAHAASAIGPV
ncbi:MAG TPA: AAA family ATPase, partial [Acidimicrobiales bacterium]